MAYQDMQQQTYPQHWSMFNYGQPQGGQGIQGGGYWPSHAAYGQFGQPNVGAWGQGGWNGGQAGWGQRHLSQQDIGEVVRQLVPLLPVVLAQAQQPMAAFGYGGGHPGAFNQGPRLLTQQDVNEVVRQILPIVPQIVGLLQGGQGPQHAGYGGYGGLGQAVFSGGQAWGQPQRQLTQQDIGEVVRQLVAAIPQMINNLQSFNQQRAI